MFSVAVPPVGSIASSPARNAIREVSGIPEGFPQFFASPLAWVGSVFKEQDFVYQFSREEITEIETAYYHFMGLELDGDRVNQTNFPLPTLCTKLREMSNEVHTGRGFCLLRGIEVDRYSVEQLTVMYLGVHSYIASELGRQDCNGNVLVHIVEDQSSKTALSHHRHSAQSIAFHNEEACHVVGWMTRSIAASGGKCIISSAYQVYNELAAARPDVVRTLAKGDWPFAMPRFKCRPIIFCEDGRLITNFGRAPLVGSVAHPRPACLPAVNKDQLEALDHIQAIAEKNRLEIQTMPGDMHFINNLAVLHRRDGFVNNGLEKRHLIRTWSRDAENGWKIPEHLQPEYFDAYDRDIPTVCHLEPMPEGWFPLRLYPN